MYKSKSILVVAPARGGSKGVKLKNLRKINGIPMIAKVGLVVKELPFVDRAVVSTDNEVIAKVAVESGLTAPFFRPPELSGDRISDLEVLTHALQETEKIDKKVYDVVVMLQPTSPLRTAKHVKDTVSRLVEGGYDAVWTVSETDSKGHPLKQLSITGDLLEHYDPEGTKIIARQQLKPVYHRNGVAYAFTRQCIIEQENIMGIRTSGLVIEGESVSIDTEWDLRLVEFILQNRAED